MIAWKVRSCPWCRADVWFDSENPHVDYDDFGVNHHCVQPIAPPDPAAVATAQVCQEVRRAERDRIVNAIDAEMGPSPFLPARAAAIMVARKILMALPRCRFSFSDEKRLHLGLAQVLRDLGINFTGEYVAGRDRFDFLCESGLVIEVKINGSYAEALYQIDRYAARDDVAAVLLTSTRAWAREQSGEIELRGKPVFVVPITTSLF